MFINQREHIRLLSLYQFEYYTYTGSAKTGLLSEAQLIEYRPVTAQIPLMEVIEQLFAFTYQMKKGTSAGMIFPVGLQMFGKCFDSGCKQSNLRFRYAGVFFSSTKLLE